MGRDVARMDLVLHLLALIRALASDRARLALENVALRQQLNVLQRSVKRAKVEDSASSRPIPGMRVDTIRYPLDRSHRLMQLSLLPDINGGVRR